MDHDPHASTPPSPPRSPAAQGAPRSGGGRLSRRLSRFAGLVTAVLALSLAGAAPVAVAPSSVPAYAAVASASAASTSATTAPAVTTVTPSALPSCALADLPSEAPETVALIEAGGPFPYDQDGTVFQNREQLLPAQPIGYYHEYTVPTPGSPDRGARRIVAGGFEPTSPEEAYYTDDHYASFCEVDGAGGQEPVPSCTAAALPPEVAETADLVRAGGPFPYPEDGTTYENREGLLPDRALGYYRVYTVPTPGSGDRGDRRLVAGGYVASDPDALYYTADHYASFCQVTG